MSRRGDGRNDRVSILRADKMRSILVSEVGSCKAGEGCSVSMGSGWGRLFTSAHFVSGYLDNASTTR